PDRVARLEVVLLRALDVLDRAAIGVLFAAARYRFGSYEPQIIFDVVFAVASVQARHDEVVLDVPTDDVTAERGDILRGDIELGAWIAVVALLRCPRVLGDHRARIGLDRLVEQGRVELGEP